MIVKNIISYIDFPAEQMEVILIKNNEDHRTSQPDNFNVSKTTLFEYSSKENKTKVFERFSKIIDKNALLVTNGYFELKAISYLKKTNKIIHIIHGTQEVEFELIKKYQGIIDFIIGVSKYICNKTVKVVYSDIPIIQINQPIPIIKLLRKSNLNKPLKIIFIGRLIEAKGVFALPVIDKLLQEKNIPVEWTIVGFGQEEMKIKNLWSFNEKVKWTGKISNEETLKFYSKNDIFILPSHSEGFPVTLIEAMKSGLVPLVSDLPSGIPEIVKNDETGYLFPINSPVLYAEKIEYLNNNREKLEELSNNALSIVNKNFDPKVQANEYKKVIEEVISAPQKKKLFIKEKFGILDKKFIPGFIVKFYRKIVS